MQVIEYPRYVVLVGGLWVSDWDSFDRVILAESRDDAFDFGGINGRWKAEREADELGGVVVSW